ncbi:hypothetical protein [Amedibacillus sp. YH-ame10]
MKKTSLLSLLTAGAIVATSAGTYAVWDTTQAEATATLTINKAINIDAGTLSAFVPTSLSGITNDAPKYTSTLTFNIETDQRANKVTFTPTIKDDSDTNITTDFNIEIKDGATSLTNNIDDEIANGDNTYTIEVTPKDAKHKGKIVNVTIGAELDAK